MLDLSSSIIIWSTEHWYCALQIAVPKYRATDRRENEFCKRNLLTDSILAVYANDEQLPYSAWDRPNQNLNR